MHQTVKLWLPLSHNDRLYIIWYYLSLSDNCLLAFLALFITFLFAGSRSDHLSDAEKKRGNTRLGQHH